MCGVGGIIAPFSSPEWKMEKMERLLLEAQPRGDEATGIAFIDPVTKKLRIIKDGQSAMNFVYKNEEYKKAAENFPAIVMGHCRSATKRTATGPEENKNNHPFFGKTHNIAMIHNGLLQDDDKWRGTVGQEGGLSYAPESVVDSEVMVVMVDTNLVGPNGEKLSMEKAIDDSVYNIAGNYVLVFLKEDEPNKIWFVRHNNPLSFGYLPEEEAVVWGSTDAIVKEAMQEYNYFHDFFLETINPDMVINPAGDDKLITVEIHPEDKENPFTFTQKKLAPATPNYDNRQNVYNEAMD